MPAAPVSLLASDLSPLSLLRDWAHAAEADWSTLPGRTDLGCYGTGYDGWGVQTQQKYLAALAVLATRGAGLPGLDPAWALNRAFAALRFNLASHRSGDLTCTDGAKWGHTWISALGIERMMFGVHLLEPHFTPADHAALRRVLTSEAEWLLTSYQRRQHVGITASKWNHEGGNDPESNLWNGALLWRAATRYPDHPQAAAWQERAHVFLLNGVSIEADAQDARLVAGKPVRERHLGPNFFPHYALDHHGYLNVGYMVICVSNAAFLHFDLAAAGLPRPESLDHHQADLWAVLRRFLFADGRLARIGGDTRVRYAYCQEYLLPALLYAEARLGDAHARTLIHAQLQLIATEARHAGDGSFYGRRLQNLKRLNPLYYTRLESDRACALASLIAYSPDFSPLAPTPPATEAFELSVAGAWCEPEHGAAVHRSPTRFASFAWRAHDLAQGLCLPPGESHFAEWQHNLAGAITFAHHPNPLHAVTTRHRRLLHQTTTPFPGGFLAHGAIMEGTDLRLAESWSGTDSAVHQIVFVVLPDDHTVVGLQYARMGPRRGYVAELKGLQFNLPNDLYNAHQRRLLTDSGQHLLTSPPAREERLGLDSAWVSLEDRLGLVGLYGADEIAIHRHPQRRAGDHASLHVEHLCFPCDVQLRRHEANTVILDAGWAVLSSVNAAQTRAFAEAHPSRPTAPAFADHPEVRAVRLTGQDRRTYIVVANFGPREATLPTLLLTDSPHRPLPSGLRSQPSGFTSLLTTTPAPETLRLPPGSVEVWVADEG